jgi:hypothetical protein
MKDMYILNRLAHERAFIEGDPRLRDATGMYLTMPLGPKISAVHVPARTGYTTLGGISAGDVVYYMDSRVNVAWPRAVYGEIDTRYTLAPFTPFSSLLIPTPVVRADALIGNKQLRQELAQRTEITAFQSRRRLINEPHF